MRPWWVLAAVVGPNQPGPSLKTIHFFKEFAGQVDAAEILTDARFSADGTQHRGRALPRTDRRNHRSGQEGQPTSPDERFPACMARE